jgi:hypothetical protein
MQFQALKNWEKNGDHVQGCGTKPVMSLEKVR